MNDTGVKQTKEFVFQRLGEPFPFSTTETPFTLAMMVAGTLLVFALLSLALPLIRSIKGAVSGAVVRLVVWAALALLAATVWMGLDNAIDRKDTAARDQLFWVHVGGQAVLGLLFLVSSVGTLLSKERLAKGGNAEGVAFGTLLTVLFGRVNTGHRTWWHWFTGAGRAMLFLVPLVCLGIARGFDTDPEPVWVLFTAGMLAAGWHLTSDMYLKDSGSVRFWGARLILAPLLLLALALLIGGVTVAVVPQGAKLAAWLVLGVVVGGLLIPLAVGGLLWLTRVLHRHEVGAWLRVYPMALLRCLALAVLAFCFLLPALQPWETTEKRSKVVMVLDISPSMAKWSDEISRDPNAKLKTRLDKVLDFLTSADGEFVAKLLDKNPVTVYRLGANLDPEPEMIRRGEEKTDQFNWKREEWEAFTRYDFKRWVLTYAGADGKGFSDEAKKQFEAAAAWTAGTGDSDWVLNWTKADDAQTGADSLAERDADDASTTGRKAADRKLLAALKEKAAKRVDMARVITQGSAVPDSVTAAVNREQANMTQAVIVFSDGRSNLSSDAAVPDLTRRAKEANIPVYTVAVGAAREVVSLVISDLQAPDRTQPDEPTQVTVAVDGIGFKQNDQVDVTLELFLPGKDPKNNDLPDFEMKQAVTFGPGETPHGETTFLLDAEEFAKKNATSLIEEINPPKPGRKWQLKKGQWKVRAKVPVDSREVFREPFHLSPVRAMEVIDKPLRVLLAAGAPSREFQILRTLMVREVEQKRAELSIYLQNEGGQKGTIVQDVPPGRLLLKFPDELDVSKETTAGAGGGDPGSDAETIRQRAKYNNLNEYDVVICFDPNWNERDDAGQFRIPSTAFAKLKTWSQTYGGGLIYVAGPFYTAQMVRNNDEAARLRPLLDMLPVEPDDIVASDDPLVRISGRKTPRRLKFNPPKDSDLLRLDDLTPQRDEALKAVAGWEQFFTGSDDPPKKAEKEYLEPKRGFFTYYPVKKVKPLAASLAEFLNVDENGREAPRPFYAVGPSGAGRAAWIGSGEMFRLRAVPDVGISFYDKFWLQLARYTSAKRASGAKSRGEVLMSKEVIAGNPIRVRARVLQSSGQEYPENDLDRPKLTIEKLDQNGEVKDRFGPFDVLKPAKLGQKFEGYYQGVVTPDPAKMTVGEFRYRASVTKGDLPEPLTAEFLLRSANPELDNTKPDLQALLDMASPLKMALDGEPDPAKRSAMAVRLGATDDDVKTGKAKLAFALDSADKLKVVPELIRSQKMTPQNRGVIDPLWDDAYDPAADPRVNWLRSELVPASGTLGQILRLWLPVAVVALLALALTWVLRTRADLPKSGIFGLLEGFATLVLGLVSVPAALVAVVPPMVALWGQTFGEMPTWGEWALAVTAAVPGLGLAVAYLAAGRYRPAVGSVALTLAMLAQATIVALAVWYGNPFPIGYAVLAMAGLLCTEWTLRKLTRLA
ncbi:MAG: VWA domain-containing protein [Fimbriiglobus sp.]|jgi:hypothetical protein|nr:VWA domain-containing protein [Fimbriiglobus sp.]